jgi:hypothetical protein
VEAKAGHKKLHLLYKTLFGNTPKWWKDCFATFITSFPSCSLIVEQMIMWLYFRVTKSRRIKRTEHVSQTEVVQNIYKIFDGKYGMNKPHVRRMHKWGRTITSDCWQTACEDVKYITTLSWESNHMLLWIWLFTYEL